MPCFSLMFTRNEWSPPFWTDVPVRRVTEETWFLKDLSLPVLDLHRAGCIIPTWSPGSKPLNRNYRTVQNEGKQTKATYL